MICGILAGITWAAETVIIGIALAMTPFVTSVEAMFLAPFVSTFIHDAASAIYMMLYNGFRRNLGAVLSVCRTRSFKFLVLSSAIGGPVGMTGYVLVVRYMGASVGSVSSAAYPAIGSVLAYLFLKENIRRSQWLFLTVTLIGVFGLSYSSDLNITNFWLGLVGILMCSFGWGIEGVILSKCLGDADIKCEYALQIRQTVSALIYGVAILPLIGAGRFTLDLFADGGISVVMVIATAAFFATVSYLCYYRAIAKLGVAKAMGLNITYTAWAVVFSVVFLRDCDILSPRTIICALLVVVCGIFAAVDFRRIFAKGAAE